MAWTRRRWLATCPITENGFVRIFGQPSYPGWPGTPERAAAALRRLIAAVPGHRFLPDEISLLDTSIFPTLEFVGPRVLTDLYLLALAVYHGARFATLDARIPAEFGRRRTGGSRSDPLSGIGLDATFFACLKAEG